MAEARLAGPESVEQEIDTIPPPEDVEKSQSIITEINTNAQIDEFPLPTEAESQTLRRVSGTLPLVAFSLCLVEFAERASYYGSKTVFSNFIQFPLPEGGNGAGATPRGTQQTAGALGMGLQASSALTLLFVFLSYVIPIFGGWWADVHVGRYKAIMVGVVICGVAHMIQIIGAIPSVLQKGSSNAAPPFILGLLVLSAGAGIFKPNVSPLILDQIRQKKAYTKQLKSGEKVIVDPDATNTRTMLIFYGFINIGAFFMLATSYAEKIHKEPPSGGSELARALHITTIALKQNKFRVWRTNFWEAADPDTLRSKGITVDWTRDAVNEIARTLGACDVFLFFPIWNLNVGGIGSVVTNQGAAMITNGVPNDVLSNFSPLTIIIAIPLLTFVVYPTLHRYRIHVGPITRLTFGFFLAMISGIVGTIVQWKVYKLSPCGYYASTCDTVAPISIWWQAPNIVLGALSECFCNVTAYELAYARSPPSMKGLVVAIFLFMNALSSALGEILIPVTKDPWLLWIWGAPAVALALQTIILWVRFKGLNNTMDGTDDPHRSVDEAKSNRRTPTGNTMDV
ncbi:hypothetical protein PENFLA_c008G10035 [Penicillium flavigenum]|uniref:Uncharacterized protein n=1 Tax=Penicillium flavigenum TaxID=254877 RepID=A0A1V6THR9_9EURO|nr:hypothetical protein PENFLA_c008G10035 [Penicillium flavigenum]